MSCCGLSIEEAYQIAYLTQHGWEYSFGWTRPGFVTTVKEWVGGDHYKDVTTPTFASTADAYERQKESEL